MLSVDELKSRQVDKEISLAGLFSLFRKKKKKNFCSGICSLCALNQMVMCFKRLNEQSPKEFL